MAKVSEQTGQPSLVDNRSGASGNIGPRPRQSPHPTATLSSSICGARRCAGKHSPRVPCAGKKAPGARNYASSGNGSTGHLIIESFLAQAGISITHIPFRGGAPAVQALVGGQIHMVIDGLPSFASHLQGGRIKLLGITSARRWPELPEVRATGESAVQGFEMGSWVVLLAPAKTPAEILRRFATETTKALAIADVQARLR